MILTQVSQLKTDKQTIEIVRNLSISCSKLYNVGLYSVKQHYEKTSEYLNYARNYHECKDNIHYKLLLTDCSQQILRIVERDCKSFFSLLKLKNSGKYSANVNFPHFKKDEQFSTITIQGRAARIKNGYVYVGLSKGFKEKYSPSIKELRFKLPKNIQASKLQELRIVPKFGGKEWNVCFVYQKDFPKPKVYKKQKYLSIDLGVDNFASCFNGQTGDSFIFDGRYIKSVNQFFNKTKSRLQPNSIKHRVFSRKRSNVLNHIFYQYINKIVNYCLENKINNIVIGELNQQKSNIGKVNNQNFCSIPYGQFISKLRNKLDVNGIQLHLQDESYTSKCSFLDNEEVCKHETYLGKRVKRGLFRTSSGLLVNADINGAANILAKFISKHNLSEVCKRHIECPRKIYFSKV